MTNDELFQLMEDVRCRTGGVLLPQATVDAAADPDHPLHGEFDWDNATAGDEWRLEQARRLIRRVRMVRVDDSEGPTDLRAYVNVRVGSTAGEYVPTEQAMADPVARQVVLRSMEREWRSLYRRYEHMQEFAEIVRLTFDEQAGT